MDKRGAALSLFIILALIMVLAGVFLYLAGSSSIRSLFTNSASQKLTLESEYNNLQIHVQSCLADKTRRGIEKYGLKWTSEEEIEQLIISEIEDCVDFPYFEERGVKITRRSPNAQVIITDDAVTSSLDFMLTVTVEDNTGTMRKFEYNLKREKSLSLQAAPISGAELRLITEDSYAELIIPYGTQLTYSGENPLISSDGNPSDALISIKMLDRNFDALNNGIILGNIVYELKPDGARISGPIVLKIRYNKEKLSPGSREENLKIVWYDKKAGLWKAIPTAIDKENQILKATVYHFSVYGVGDGCASYDTQQAAINEINLQQMAFIQLCGTMDEGGSGTCQKVTDGPGWSGTGIIEGLEEKAYTGQQPIVKAPNPGTPEGQIPYTRELSLLDWDQDDQEAESESQVTIVSVPGYTVCSTPSFKQDCIEDCSGQAKESFAGLEDRFFSKDSLRDGQPIICEGHVSIPLLGQASCTGVSCSKKEVATPMTYGYEDEGQAPASLGKTLAGGFGVLFFTAADDGDTCVAGSETRGDNQLELTKLSVALVKSGEEQSGDYPYLVCADPASGSALSCDNFVTSDPSKVIRQVLYNPSMLIDNSVVSGLDDDPGEDYGIRSGQNGIYFRTENLDEDEPDGCLWTEMGMTLWGTGINQSQLDMEIDTASEALESRSFGYTYGGLDANGWTSCLGAWNTGDFPTLSPACAELGTDPDADSDSEYCTNWEASLTTEQVTSLIAEKAALSWIAMKPHIRSELEKSGMDKPMFQKLIIAIAMQESSLSHCSPSGRVKTGDGGSSAGLMQVPNTAETRRLTKNIEKGIDMLIGKYTMVDCREGHTLDCSDTCSSLSPAGGCSDTEKTYTGWECAARGYNGWGCKYKAADGNYRYCGPDCNNYVGRVSSYIDQIGEIPKCTGSFASASGSSAQCTLTTSSPSYSQPGAPTITTTIPSTPISSGITIPPGNYGTIISTAQNYLGCHYVYDPAYGTNAGNCKDSGMGFTCATFVATVVSQACGVHISGHGSMICDYNPELAALGTDPGVLQPGDIFSWGTWNNGAGTYGHTGIYVGKNSDGDYLFIDANPNRGVAYTTLAQEGSHSDMRYCRVTSC